VSYKIKYSDRAEKDIGLLKKSGNKSALKKIDVLLNELIEHPRSGTGHPEQLKGFGEIDR
jgi:toxin YoeB